jgi:hypothetical protein
VRELVLSNVGDPPVRLHLVRKQASPS